ncbi:putative pumilio homolog 8, chloroplastic [Cornus florida]|uniref:putative pumilio homolog 8, chloroplastic n=1 Tax=Cornus florida TaxID=4283 RepID=UPI00289D274F|nr:putative pumilio homolog 8, chloroplastic [Cornus florida]
MSMGGSTSESPTNSTTPSFENDLLSYSFLNLDLYTDDDVDVDDEVIRACNHVNNISSDEGNNVVVNGCVGSSSNTDVSSDARSTRSSDNWSPNSGDHTQQRFFALPMVDQDNIWTYHQNPTYGQDALLWNRNSAMNGNQYFNPESQNLCDSDSNTHHQFGATTNYGTGYFGNGGYHGTNGCVGEWSEPIPELFWPGYNIITLAKDKERSRDLQNLLKSESYYADLILMRVLDSMLELMIDKQGHHVFEKLVEAYTGRYDQLQLIVDKIILQPCSLTDAACNQYGSHSIQKLIKQLKKSPLAFKMTKALSTGFYDLMIDKTGKHVILQCFTALDYKANQVLYLEAIGNCVALATHPEGCISLNDCINCITGDHRQYLLGVISHNSVYLSYDPSGNYVVQHVLGLHNQDLTLDICNRLRGHYTGLSMIQNGSHVVEKCIRLSKEGMHYVVEDFIQSNNLQELARHRFGNYVIQTALKTTKKADIDLYKSLASALQPHLSTLQNCKPGGQNVVKLIRGGF